jgi:hypothetical protein
MPRIARHNPSQGRLWLGMLIVSIIATIATHQARAEIANTADDVVSVQARVVGTMIVDAEGQVIDLGQVIQGMSFSVPSDGSGTGEVATFRLNAPANADIALTVIYADLLRSGTTDVVAIGAPDGPAVCFRQVEGAGACDVEVDEPAGGGIRRNQTGGGDGIAYVGYSVAVPIDAEPGTYANDEAITLEAEALLGGPPQF